MDRADILTFHAAEAMEIHRLLDEAGVPRGAYGETLSMSQRVAECLRMHRLDRRTSVQSR